MINGRGCDCEEFEKTIRADERTKTIEECVDILNDSFPLIANMDIVFGFKCAVERLEQLKEQKKEGA